MEPQRKARMIQSIQVAKESLRDNMSGRFLKRISIAKPKYPYPAFTKQWVAR